jgi:DegV family protein with EDD domain
MSRIRSRVVFILLVLILLLASALFGVLTYWLEGKLPPTSDFSGRGEMPCAAGEPIRSRWEKGSGPGDKAMNQVAVVTDSSANLPGDLAQELNIRIVPVLLTFEGQTLRDGVDITPGQVYRWLRANKHIPTTSSPSVGDFVRVYAAAGREADGIVSIHLSPRFSATYNTAVAASQLVDHVPIRVVNCHTVAMGQGFVVLEAARAAAAGADLEAVIARATAVAAKTNLLATLGTFEYLYRGGRIGGAATLLGTMLQIKPIVYVADGHVDVFAKPRTKARAIRLMLQRMAEVADGRPLHVAILQADVPDEAEALRQQVTERFDCAELYVTEFTPVMGAHSGPGVLGVAFYAE